MCFSIQPVRVKSIIYILSILMCLSTHTLDRLLILTSYYEINNGVEDYILYLSVDSLMEVLRKEFHVLVTIMKQKIR